MASAAKRLETLERDQLNGYVIPKSRAKAPAAQPVQKEEDTKRISVVKYKIALTRIRIEGNTPLVVKAWDQKAIQMIQDKQAGKASVGRAKRDPKAEYEGCFYRKKDGTYGFPMIGLKAAVVTAATSLGKAIPKTLIRQAFHILDTDGDGLSSIHYPEDCPPQMHTGMVKIGMGVADVRYRPKFDRWGIEFDLQFNESAMSEEQIVNLFNLAGFAVGVGEHRPERDGAWGQFRVVGDFSWNEQPKRTRKKK